MCQVAMTPLDSWPLVNLVYFIPIPTCKYMCRHRTHAKEVTMFKESKEASAEAEDWERAESAQWWAARGQLSELQSQARERAA